MAHARIADMHPAVHVSAKYSITEMRRIMSLRKAYEPYFKIGVAISRKDMDTPKHLELVKGEFNSFTCENEMKPMFLLDYETISRDPVKYDRCPVITLDRVRKYLDFARDNHIPLRGHTLVWHNQTPFWFFHENYDEKAPLADKEAMLARLRGYIRAVLTAVQAEYPGVIYAWDVVNEAVDEGGFRPRSLWQEIVGEEFIFAAFETAREYAEPGVLLFYNDYTTYEHWKRDFIVAHILKPLLDRGLIDGMGMQSHLLMDEPELDDYRLALETYGALGLVIHATELDIHNNDASDQSMQALADRYAKLFEIYLDAKTQRKANVDCVTFWCLLDEESWLTGFRRETSYPLLFHGDCEPKAAYDSVLAVAQKYNP